MKKFCPAFFLDKQPKSSKVIFYNIDVFSEKNNIVGQLQF
jgi:hypothetical protein